MIFNKFYRVKSKEVSKNICTGVGLTVVKGLVELMHGHIHVESKIDQGTSFAF